MPYRPLLSQTAIYGRCGIENRVKKGIHLRQAVISTCRNLGGDIHRLYYQLRPGHIHDKLHWRMKHGHLRHRMIILFTEKYMQRLLILYTYILLNN